MLLRFVRRTGKTNWYSTKATFSFAKDDSQLFVLAVEEGGNCAVLVHIEARGIGPAKPTFSATLKEMVGWKPLYISGPRYVQALHVRSHRLMWEAYVPGIVEALNLADEIYTSEVREIDLLIHTCHRPADEIGAVLVIKIA